MRRLVALDVETTGTDPWADRIVEIALHDPDSGLMLLEERVNPGQPIPPEASACHGITDADVAGLPGFERWAGEVQRALDGATLLTYAGRSFDVVIVDRELREAGEPGIDLEAVTEIDLYRCWLELEPRTLEGAVRRYLGREHQGSHSAAADAEILGRLLNAVCTKHRVALEELASMSRPDSEVDRSGKFIRSEHGEILFNFSKNAGEPALNHPGMLRWMLQRDFPQDSLDVARQLLEQGCVTTSTA